jgi:glycosyltransferase involved in cell wall biosynthesis
MKLSCHGFCLDNRIASAIVGAVFLSGPRANHSPHESSRMRLLWISDSPDTPSGFGNVTRFVCEGLVRRGHQVSILGWQTKQEHSWNGCRVYPSAGALGNMSLFPFLVRQRPEVVIALGDVWWLPYFNSPHVRRQMELSDTPWALYFPIDGDTSERRLPPSWIELLREVDLPIAMSRYGRDVVKDCGIACHYIPHGVDLDLFSPPASREDAKARVGYDGKFVVLSDSRNQPRKMLPRLLDVFARFAKARPDALLHLHTDPEDEFTRSGLYSYDVRADLRHLGIESQVCFTPGMTMKHNGGVPLETLASFYQAADIHLLASTGEGFGLPTLQAAAAGAVPMAGCYSASKELVEGHGESIEIAEWIDNEFGIRRGLIDIDDAVKKLATFYDNRSLLSQRSAQARQFALEYGWNKIIDQWDALLRSVAARTRRIMKVTEGRPLDKDMASRILPQFEGATIKVNVVERQYGRLEANIVADTQGRLSDVWVPGVQQSCEVGGLRVVRQPAYMGVALGDQVAFLELKHIFPMLAGWVPAIVTSHSQGEPNLLSKRLHAVQATCSQELRYQVAQSVLLLNVSGDLPEATLIDAGLYGVPCIGTSRSGAQRTLWPELTTDSLADAVRIARMVLTNPARLRRLAGEGRRNCQSCYAPSEHDAATWLRQLHHAQSPYGVTTKGAAHGNADVHGGLQRGLLAGDVAQCAAQGSAIRGLHFDGYENRNHSRTR